MLGSNMLSIVFELATILGPCYVRLFNFSKSHLFIDKEVTASLM